MKKRSCTITFLSHLRDVSHLVGRRVEKLKKCEISEVLGCRDDELRDQVAPLPATTTRKRKEAPWLVEVKSIFV